MGTHRVRALVAAATSALLLPLVGGSADAGEDMPPCPTARCSPATPTLKGSDNGKRPDRLLVNAIAKTAGAEVRLIRLEGDGERTVVGTGTLNDKGNHRFRVEDLNGRRATKYVAKISATETTDPSATSKKRVR